MIENTGSQLEEMINGKISQLEEKQAELLKELKTVEDALVTLKRASRILKGEPESPTEKSRYSVGAMTGLQEKIRNLIDNWPDGKLITQREIRLKLAPLYPNAGVGSLASTISGCLRRFAEMGVLEVASKGERQNGAFLKAYEYRKI